MSVVDRDARDQVSVQVWDCLPCCRAIIESDVVAIWFEFGIDALLGRMEQDHDCVVFFRCQIKE